MDQAQARSLVCSDRVYRGPDCREPLHNVLMSSAVLRNAWGKMPSVAELLADGTGEVRRELGITLILGHDASIRRLTEGFARSIGFSEEQVKDMVLLARYHDIGKFGLDQAILLKPEALSRDERVHLQEHCKIGFCLANDSEELHHISKWILFHHEWWDGTGYPYGLAGEEIPLQSRFIAIIDAYDAMINDRPYRSALSARYAAAEIAKKAGRQFDPMLSKLFVRYISDLQYDEL